MLIAIEGIDGAGKNTVANALKSALFAIDLTSTIVQFPQYDQTYGGRALGDFLSKRFYTPTDIRVIATLYAIDRFESIEKLRSLINENDVVICDRYICSNLAFQAAKVAPDCREALLDWVIDLETRVFGLPLPALNVFLRTPVERANKNVMEKVSRSYTSEKLDLHEQDSSLQNQAQRIYEKLAEEERLGKWLTIDTTNTHGERESPVDMAGKIIHFLESDMLLQKRL